MAPVAVGMASGGGEPGVVVGWAEQGGGVGLAGVTAMFVSISFWQPETGYLVIGLTFFLLAFSMGNIMAPSTDSVMGAVPEANAGIASAMNDVTRQVAGAFGVAVIGSIINTVYGNRMSEAVAGLPPEAAEAASDSVGAAARVASTLPPEVSGGLLEAARTAFTDALGVAVLAGAGVAITGALLIARFMPAQHLPEGEATEAGSEVAAS